MRSGGQRLGNYEEAGWLLLQTYSTPKSRRLDMHFAVWRIFDPTVPINSNSQNWINLAAANYQGVAYSEVDIRAPAQIQRASYRRPGVSLR